VAAVEALIPAAVRGANFSKINYQWQDLTKETQEAAHKAYIKTQRDAGWIYPDDTELGKLNEKYRQQLRANDAPIIEKTLEHLQERLDSEQGHGHYFAPATRWSGPKVDLTTLHVLPGTGKVGDDGFVIMSRLDEDALRTTTGERLLPDERAKLQGIWSRLYEDQITRALDDLRDYSNEYRAELNVLKDKAAEEAWQNLPGYEKYSVVLGHNIPKAFRADKKPTDAMTTVWEEVDPAIQTEAERRFVARVGGDRQAQWDAMSSDEKWEALQQSDLKPSKVITDAEAQAFLPDHWVTGVEHGSKADEDYGRTQAIAHEMTRLRTDQLRKERGLLEPTQKPTSRWNVLTGSTRGSPRRRSGQVVASSNTEEQLRINAEEWAAEIATRPGTVKSQDLIQTVWQEWKSSSSNGLSLSLQLATAREFGGDHRLTPEEVQKAEDEATYFGGIATMQAYVRAQWETTQFIMSKARADRPRSTVG
jgi:hypothetical protein